MFGMMKKTYMGEGVLVGMVAGAAVVTAAVLACPQGRCMARRMMKQGRRTLHRVAPALERRL